jgi:hypothetical protein
VDSGVLNAALQHAFAHLQQMLYSAFGPSFPMPGTIKPLFKAQQKKGGRPFVCLSQTCGKAADKA